MTQVHTTTIIVLAMEAVLAYFVFAGIHSHYDRPRKGLIHLTAIATIVAITIIALFATGS